MSKFEVIDYPRVRPHKCLGCGGTGRSRSYLDLGLSVDRYGRLYLCTLCVAEVAEVVGYVSSVKYEAKKAEAEAWEEHYQELQKKWKELNNAVDTLRNSVGISSVNSSSGGPLSLPYGEELPESDPEQGSDDSEFVKSDTGSGFGIL